MNVAVILLGQRTESALQVQSILTKNGDIIRTRLGMNRQIGSNEGASGFIFIELCGDDKRADDLVAELNQINNVTAKMMKVELPNCSCSC